MLKERTIEGLSKRWRLRLKAGALALLFAAFSLLPWMHVLTLGSSVGHRCCHQDSSTSPVNHSPAIAPEVADAPDTCWVCQSLVSLLQHADSARDTVFVSDASLTSFIARAPHAPSVAHIYPACRSQAPPARA